MKFNLSRASFFVCLCLCVGHASTLPRSPVPSPFAVATSAEANYCFARVRGLDPGRLPPAYLVLQLRVRVSYRNPGNRPLIIPLERERTIYTALKPGAMTVFHAPFTLLDPAWSVMKDLPADVSPDSPINPPNDVFAVIPARGEMTPPTMEEITLPVDRKSLFRKDPDLRGHRVYLKLKFAHRELSGALETDLSDRWARFGVPWSGTLMTNTITIDVPEAPQGLPCKDNYTPAGTEAPIEGK
jgi:hypothetical protein